MEEINNEPPQEKVPAVEEQSNRISIAEFSKVELRIGSILEAAEHPNADRLLVLKVDLGESAPRTLVAGIKSGYVPESLPGKQVVVVSNLEPAQLRGVTSEGMILAANDADGISILNPERKIIPGTRVK